MIKGYSAESGQRWEGLSSDLLDDAARGAWLTQWRQLLGIKSQLETSGDQPYAVISGLQDRENGIVDAFTRSISESREVGGFLTSADHSDERIRVRAAVGLRELWGVDKELTKSAFVRLAHDDSDEVRFHSLEAFLIMLYGYGLESEGEPIVHEQPDRKELQSLLSDAIQDINRALGI